jgi:quercetin dioxygenase-like cupin family protein
MADQRGWTAVHLDELERVPVEGAGVVWRPIRRRLGIRAFGMNAYSANTGEHVVEEHTESFLGHEEVYVVVSGRARFTLGGETVDAPAGTLVHLGDPSVHREAVAEEDGTVVLAVGAKPGEAFEPSAWEWSFATAPHRAAGDYESALELLREGLAARPEDAALLYEVACYEALSGRREQALEHLESAAARSDRIAGWARTDDDFASVKDDPRFIAIVGG